MHRMIAPCCRWALAALRRSPHSARRPAHPAAHLPCPADGVPDQPATATLTPGAQALTAEFACTADELAHTAYYSYELVRTDPAIDVTVFTASASPQVAASSLTPSGTGKCSFAVAQADILDNDNKRGIFTLKLVSGRAAVDGLGQGQLAVQPATAERHALALQCWCQSSWVLLLPAMNMPLPCARAEGQQ